MAEEIQDPASYSIKDLILYKLDRTLAIAGLVAIGVWSLAKDAGSPEIIQVTIAVVGVLGGYIGGRSASK
jgi:hypothetical protein